MAQSLMRTSTTKPPLEKTPKSYYAREQNLKWQAKKKQLLRDGTILRWRTGYVSRPARIGGTEAEEQEHDSDSTLVVRSSSGQSDHSDDKKLRRLFHNAQNLYFDQIGGLRTDPFNALPIASKGRVPVTFDFLAQYWAQVDMADMPRGSDGRPVLYGTYFTSLLSDPMLFELMMAFCMLMQSLHRGEVPKLNAEGLLHVSNGMAILRERLLSNGEKSTSDMVIRCIVVLGTIAVITYDFQSLESHVTGMNRIIALRGGHETLGMDGYVATRCRQIEAGWLSVQKLEKESKENGGDSIDTLIYPSHPFSPDLCARLARIPPGLSDLALQGKMSFRFISIIEDIMAWECDTGEKATRTSPIALPSMFLAVSGQTQIETLLALTFLAYCAFTQRQVGRSHPSSESALEHYAKDIINDAHIWNLKNQDAFIWCMFMLAGTVDSKSEIYKWSHRMLDDIRPSGKKKEELEKAFLTIPLEK